MTISIVLCTYNGELYLPEQLQSIVAQTLQPDELIISDDASTDETWSIIQNFAATAPFEVKTSRNETNLGVTKNFESALRLASGDIIFLSDQDDWWEEQKVARIATIFEKDSSVGMVFTDAKLVDRSLNPLNKTLWQTLGLSPAQYEDFLDEPFAFLLTRQNLATGATTALRRDVVDRALPFPPNMPVLHDAWLGLIASCISNVWAHPACLMSYRQHETQMFGIRPNEVDPGKSHYRGHLEQLCSLTERSEEHADLYPESNTILVREYIKHLEERLKLPASPLLRTPKVIGELLSGRYGKFSNGIKSAVKDLLHG